MNPSNHQYIAVFDLTGFPDHFKPVVNNITAEEILSPLTEPKSELENSAEDVLIENHIEPIEFNEIEIADFVEELAKQPIITPEPIIEHQTAPETNNANTTLNFNFDTTPEPTIEDLEKLMVEQEKESEVEHAKPEVQVTLPLTPPPAKPAFEENVRETSLGRKRVRA